MTYNVFGGMLNLTQPNIRGVIIDALLSHPACLGFTLFETETILILLTDIAAQSEPPRLNHHCPSIT